MLRIPMIIVNTKTYEQSNGKKAMELAKLCEEVVKETGTEIALAVPAADIYPIVQATSIPVLAQHVDAVEYGSHTGAVIPENIRDAGATGTLLNHSEKNLVFDDIEKSIQRCKSLGLMTVVCAGNQKQAQSLAMLSPEAVAVEPPELIGGDISISTARPEVITQTVNAIHHDGKCGIVLVGAGVKNAKDVSKSIELGAKGVLLASGVTKAKNPKEVLLDLARGIQGTTT
ncbi:MAG: triose-phosphate isomerase [Candidatus Woesearchaeota archaeon]